MLLGKSAGYFYKEDWKCKRCFGSRCWQAWQSDYFPDQCYLPPLISEGAPLTNGLTGGRLKKWRQRSEARKSGPQVGRRLRTVYIRRVSKRRPPHTTPPTRRNTSVADERGTAVYGREPEADVGGMNAPPASRRPPAVYSCSLTRMGAPDA